jgi:PilZ domain
MSRVAPVDVDCRRRARESIRKQGRLVTSWQQHGILVEVRDMSPYGARIRLDKPASLPPLFQLWLDEERVVYPSRICWRSKDQIGIEFIDPVGRATFAVPLEQLCR